MTEKFAQRFSMLGVIEQSKLGTLSRATDGATGAPALVLQLASDPGDEALDAIVEDNRRLESCPDILVTYAYGRDVGSSWLAVEATDGFLVEEAIKRRDKVELGPLLRVALGLARAAETAAEVSVQHLDLGPHRLWSEGESLGGAVRAFGFGWWRLMPALTTANQEDFYGTPEYLASEICKHQPGSPASDVYAAATTLWAIAAAKPPFQSSQAMMTLKRQSVEKPLRLDLVKPALKGVKDLQALIALALDKDPAKRPTAGEWREAIEGLWPTWGGDLEPAHGAPEQRERLFSGAVAAPEPAAKPAPEPEPKPEPKPEPEPEPKPAREPEPVAPPQTSVAAGDQDPDKTVTLARLEVQQALAEAADAEDGDEDDEDDAEAAAAGPVTPGKRGRKSKKSRRDRATLQMGSGPLKLDSAKTPGKPEPIKLDIQRGEASKPAPAIVAESVKAAVPAAGASVGAGAGTQAVAAKAEPAASVRIDVTKAIGAKPAEASAALAGGDRHPSSPGMEVGGRKIKTTDRVRVEQLQENLFFQEEHPLPKDLHDLAPPIPPRAKTHRGLVAVLALFVTAMLGSGVWLATKEPPAPPPPTPEEQEAQQAEAAAQPEQAAAQPEEAKAAEAPPAPTPEPAPAAAPAEDVQAAALAAAPDAGEPAAANATDSAAQSAELVDAGEALLRAGTLDAALEKARAAKTLNPGNANATALEAKVMAAQADAAKSAADQAAKAAADQKAAEEAKATADAAAARQSEQERKQQEAAAAKRAEEERKKEEAAQKKEEEALKAAEMARAKAAAAEQKAAAARLAREKALAEAKSKPAERPEPKKVEPKKEEPKKEEPKKEVKKDPPPVKTEPKAAEPSDGQKEAAKLAALAQKASTAKLRVLYLKKAVEKDPANGQYKTLLKRAEAELASQQPAP